MTYLRITAPALLAALPAMPTVAAPEPAERWIDEIVVVATLREQSLRKVAGNISFIRRDDLQLELANSTTDMLRYTPGVDHESGSSRFGTEGISIRGIGGNRVALLIDDVPLADQFDIGSFSNATRDFTNAGFVEKVEVLHGPASSLYGSAAIGGVVSLRTPDPIDVAPSGLGGRVALASRGADDSTHGTGIIAATSGNIGWLVGASLRSGGAAEANGADPQLDQREVERRSAMLKLVVDDAAGNAWRLGYYRQDTDVTSDTRSNLLKGRFRSTTALLGDDRYVMDMWSGEVRFAPGGDWIDSGVVRVYHQRTDVDQVTLDERAAATTPVSIDRRFTFEQAITGFDINLVAEHVTANTIHEMGAGIEYRRRRTIELRDGLSTTLATGVQTNVLLGEVFPLRDFPISTGEEWGIYVEDVISVGKFTIIASLRADRFDLAPEQDPIYAEDYPFAPPVSLDDAAVSPKLGIVYRVSPALDVFTQFTHGFRAPPYEDANIGLELPVFNVRAIANPDLASERSNGLEAGLRWQGEATTAHLTVFRTHYDDFIETKVRLGPDPVSGRVLFQSQNLSKATISGIEAGGQWNLPGGFSAHAAVYFADGENGQTGDALGSVGPPQGILGLDWVSPDGQWQGRIRTTLTRAWDDHPSAGGAVFEPPGVGTIDLFAARRLPGHLTLRMGVTNLTDRHYWRWSDVRSLGPADPTLPYVAQPGRSVTFGIDATW